MEQHKLTLRVVEVGTPEWAIAVKNKKQRAFTMVAKEGIPQDETERRYEAYFRDKGIAFHDERLRQEVGEGQLLSWWSGDIMMAYAPVGTASLIGIEDRLVFNVADVWAQKGLELSHCDQIVSDLLEHARTLNALHVQIYCDDALADSNLRLGGDAVKHWFRYNLTSA